MPGTVFNEITKVCDWSENAQRHNCARVKNFIEHGIAENLKALKSDVHVFKQIDAIQQIDGTNRLIEDEVNKDLKNVVSNNDSANLVKKSVEVVPVEKDTELTEVAAEVME